MLFFAFWGGVGEATGSRYGVGSDIDGKAKMVCRNSLPVLLVKIDKECGMKIRFELEWTAWAR